MRRPRLRVVAIAAASLLLGGCGDGGDGDPPSPTGSDPTSSPTEAGPAPGDGDPGAVEGALEVEVEPGAGGLTIAWTWTNEGDEPVYVVDSAPGPAGPLSDTSAYVVGLSGADGAVQVSERLFDRPDSDPNDYYAPFLAGVVEVRPGGSVEREVTVPLPLTEAKPFGGYYADGETAVADDPTSVTFCVGALVPPYAGGLVQRDDDATTTAHGSTDAQTLFCADPARIAD